MSDKKRIKTAITGIQKILWEEWDPIGVSQISEAFGEYDSYAGKIYQLLLEGIDDNKIVDHLYHLEVDDMGLNGQSREKLLDVVKMLRAIDIL